MEWRRKENVGSEMLLIELFGFALCRWTQGSVTIVFKNGDNFAGKCLNVQSMHGKFMNKWKIKIFGIDTPVK